MPRLYPSNQPIPLLSDGYWHPYYEQGYDDGYADCMRRSRVARDEGIAEAKSTLVNLDPKIFKPKRKGNKWNTFLKRFKFRRKKPRESAKAYFKARTKAASKKYKRIKK